ncbi:MAG: C39 family peptidase [Bacillota bacterium]
MFKFLVTLPIIAALIFIGALSAPMLSLENYLPTSTHLGMNVLNPDNYSLNLDLETNSFDKQGYNMCSGYAAAFIRRYYGQPAAGTQIYKEMAYNLPFDIGVPPHKLLSHFQKNNLLATARTGGLEEIKYFSSQQIPVIVLVGEGLKWQHYMVLVGYNNEKDEMYFYDPEAGPALVARENPGNKTFSTNEFTKIWENNLPFFSQLFITVEKPNSEHSV